MREFSFPDDNWEMYEYIYGENPVKMLVDDAFDDYWCGLARRPYYQLRGKPVTPEQAMEIFIRTESVWSWEFDYEKTLPGYVSSNLCRNSCYNIPLDWRTCWVHPDGTIGQNNMFGFKWAEVNEIMRDFVPLVSAFPYLDFFVGVSYYDEHLPEKEDWHLPEWEEYQEKGFSCLIEYGIWIHDKTIEIVDKDTARKLYREYERLYEVSNKAIYETDYYTDKAFEELDWEYFKRAVESVNMPNAEEFLRDYAARLKKRAEHIPGEWYNKLLASKTEYEIGGNSNESE